MGECEAVVIQLKGVKEVKGVMVDFSYATQVVHLVELKVDLKGAVSHKNLAVKINLSVSLVVILGNVKAAA